MDQSFTGLILRPRQIWWHTYPIYKSAFLFWIKRLGYHVHAFIIFIPLNDSAHHSMVPLDNFVFIQVYRVHLGVENFVSQHFALVARVNSCGLRIPWPSHHLCHLLIMIRFLQSFGPRCNTERWKWMIGLNTVLIGRYGLMWLTFLISNFHILNC